MNAGAAMRVVFSPDSFKGSISAERAAAALAAGWGIERPEDTVLLRPMADGGEGSLDTVAAAVPGARRIPVEVTGPDDRAIDAHWLRLPDGSAVVELAETSGLLRLAKDPQGEPVLQPRSAHTLGTGQAIRAAIEAGARRVFVALGGSASSDGGAGILVGLGARLLDDAGHPLEPGNTALERIAEVDRSGVIPMPPAGITAWTDVRSPLLGPEGAVAVFGPQKGLRGVDAERAEAALERWAVILGGDPALPGTGAAGGAGFALARIGAELRGGAASIAEIIGLDGAVDGAVAGADLVVTGEGSFDAQSAQGKVVSLVQRIAAERGVPVALVAGRIGAPTDGFVAAHSLLRLAGQGQDPMRDAEAILREAGRRLAVEVGRA